MRASEAGQRRRRPGRPVCASRRADLDDHDVTPSSLPALDPAGSVGLRSRDIDVIDRRDSKDDRDRQQAASSSTEAMDGAMTAMTSPVLVGIDVGTTRVKAVAIDLQGNVQAEAAEHTPWRR